MSLPRGLCQLMDDKKRHALHLTPVGTAQPSPPQGGNRGAVSAAEALRILRVGHMFGGVLVRVMQ